MLVGEALTETMDQPATSRRGGRQAGARVRAHSPTGGGTLSTAIARNYAPQKSPGNYQRGPEKTRQCLEQIAKSPGQWQAFGDHVPYGLFRRYLPAGARYITVLRDPVDRVLSHYHFHAQAGDPPGIWRIPKLWNIWETLLNNERLNETAPRTRTRSCSIREPNTRSRRGCAGRSSSTTTSTTRFLWGGESLYGELPPHAVEKAKENLSTFWFVAFRERLDDSIVLLGRKLGVGLMPYYLRHVSQKRPPLVPTSRTSCAALIVEHNALDVELYRFAQEHFGEEFPSRRTRRGRA